MSFWPAVYVGFLVLIGVASTRSTIQKRYGPGTTALEALTSIAWPLLVAAYFSVSVAQLVGLWSVPLYAVALIWTLITVRRDIWNRTPDPRLTPRGQRLASRISTVITVVIVVPVVVLGARVVLRALGSAV